MGLLRQLLFVSVPLRGKGRDQPGNLANLGLRCTDVSVPLRGKGRDQQKASAPIDWDQIDDVSVPLRGKGRDQPGIKIPEGYDGVLSFRPLAGKR